MRPLPLLAATLATFAVPMPAAQAGWGPARTVVEGDDAGLLASTALPLGGVRLALEDHRHGYTLAFADLSLGGRLGDPVAVLRKPAEPYTVAFDGAGGGLALGSDRSRVSVTAFDPTGALSTPGGLESAGDRATLAVAPDGSAAVAWLREGPVAAEVVAAFREAGSSDFGPAQRAGFTTTANTNLEVGIGDRGEAVVAWQVNNFPSALAAAVRRPGAGFSPGRFLTRNASGFTLAVGAGGQAILAPAGGRRLMASVKAPGASTMPRLSTVDRVRGYGGYEIGVATGGRRRVALTWNASSRPRAAVRTRVYAGSAPGHLRRVATLGGSTDTPRLALGSDGALAVAWEAQLPALRHDPTARSRLGLAYKPAGGRFERSVLRSGVSLNHSPEAVLISRGGRAVVLAEAFEPGEARRSPGGYRRLQIVTRAP